ncbi:MAG: PIN domain-containing protein [Janthinobacterium lividum]
MSSRVLLDTNIVRAGFVSQAGASRLLLQAVLTGRATAVASTALMLEYEDVLLRPVTLQRAGVAAQDALTFLDGLCAVCLPVTVRVRWRPQSPDSSDDLVIDAAVNGLVDTIATFNLRDLQAPAARFGIAAEMPADILRRLR